MLSETLTVLRHGTCFNTKMFICGDIFVTLEVMTSISAWIVALCFGLGGINRDGGQFEVWSAMVPHWMELVIDVMTSIE